MTSQFAPKLFGLVIIPTGAGVFRFAAFEDIAHTVEQWAIECNARHAAIELFPDSHEGKTGGRGLRVFGEPCDQCVMMSASGGLATFSAQAPNGFLEMNPEIVRLSPHQGEEHLDAHCIRQLSHS